MKYIKLLFFMISIMVGINASADTFEYEGLCYRTLMGNKVEVVHWRYGALPYERLVKDGKLSIPETVFYNGDEYTVVQIGESAFYKLENVIECEIPKTIVSIGESAFYYDYTLEKISFPEGLISIGTHAFGNTKLSSLNLPNSLTTINESAFIGTQINELVIPNSVTFIGKAAFSSCKNLTKVVIGSGVSEIEEYPFIYCYNLSSIIVNEDNENFCSENNTLYTKDKKGIICVAPNQTGEYIMPNSVTSIEKAAMEYTNFYSIKISENLSLISGGCFSNCNNLIAVIVPESVTYIDSDAWERCSHLKSIVFGKNVLNIVTDVVKQNTELENIFCFSTRPPVINDYTFDETHFIYSTLYVPESALDRYKDHKIWSKFRNIKGLSEDKAKFIPMESISFEYDKLVIGRNEVLNANYSISPEYVTVPYLKWESSNPNIATVKEGKITGISEGYCTITAYSVDGSGVKASFEVEVKDNAGIDDALDEPDSEAVEYYNIHGIKLMQPTKGVNIVKYKDGTVRKVYNR